MMVMMIMVMMIMAMMIMVVMITVVTKIVIVTMMMKLLCFEKSLNCLHSIPKRLKKQIACRPCWDTKQKIFRFFFTLSVVLVVVVYIFVYCCHFLMPLFCIT